jgi:hypothetical protein
MVAFGTISGMARTGSPVALGLMLSLSMTMMATSTTACGPAAKGSTSPTGAATSGASPTGDGANAPGSSAASSAEPVEPPEDDRPVEKPFAKTSTEATSMMDDAVEKKQKRINKCVDEYRKRKGEPMAKLIVKIGVDQEGNLIGVTSKPTDADAPALDCIRVALKRAPFPKSHAGVIEITKTFEYQAVYKE